MFVDSALLRIFAAGLGMLVLAVIVDRYLFFAKGTPRPVMNMLHDNILFGIDAEDLISRSSRLGQCYKGWSLAEYPPELIGSRYSSYSEQAKLEKRRDRWMLRRLETMRGISVAHDKIKSHLRSRFKGETGDAAAYQAEWYFNDRPLFGLTPNTNSCSSVGRSHDFFEVWRAE